MCVSSDSIYSLCHACIIPLGCSAETLASSEHQYQMIELNFTELNGHMLNCGPLMKLPPANNHHQQSIEIAQNDHSADRTGTIQHHDHSLMNILHSSLQIAQVWNSSRSAIDGQAVEPVESVLSALFSRRLYLIR